MLSAVILHALAYECMQRAICAYDTARWKYWTDLSLQLAREAHCAEEGCHAYQAG